MRRFLFVLLACIAAIAAPVLNWSGVTDTTIAGTFRADSFFVGKAWPLTDGENTILYLLADDSSVVGYSIDTLRIEWGYQVGWPKKFPSGWGTAWSGLIVVDTLDTLSTAQICPSSYSATARYTTDLTDGSIDLSGGYVDTCSFSGWQLQWQPISPPWGTYIRQWFKGLTGNSATAIELQGGKIQRDHVKAK
jgi:hypothetical protein